MGGIPECSLLASRQTASFTMENGFLQWCHPIPENKNKEYVKKTFFPSTTYLPALAGLLKLRSSLTLIHCMRVHYPTKI
jgi:hypothetical protein